METANDEAEHSYPQTMAIENHIRGLGYNVVSAWECSHPGLSTKQLIRKFVPYPHYIIYNFKAVSAKKDLSVTSDLMRNSSHILISIVINDRLTQEPIFLHNQDLERLIKEFVAELVRQQQITFHEVVKLCPMVDEDSLLSRVLVSFSNMLGFFNIDLGGRGELIFFQGVQQSCQRLSEKVMKN